MRKELFVLLLIAGLFLCFGYYCESGEKMSPKERVEKWLLFEQNCSPKLLEIAASEEALKKPWLKLKLEKAFYIISIDSKIIYYDEKYKKSKTTPNWRYANVIVEYKNLAFIGKTYGKWKINYPLSKDGVFGDDIEYKKKEYYGIEKSVHNPDVVIFSIPMDTLPTCHLSPEGAWEVIPWDEIDDPAKSALRKKLKELICSKPENRKGSFSDLCKEK